MLEFMGIRPHIAEEICNTFQTQNREDERDLFLHSKNFLLVAYEIQRTSSNESIILEHMGLTVDENEAIRDLASFVLGDQIYVLNVVSKENLREWAIISMESRFISMKLLSQQTLHKNFPMPPTLTFPLSLLTGVVPGQTVGYPAMPPPNGFNSRMARRSRAGRSHRHPNTPTSLSSSRLKNQMGISKRVGSGSRCGTRCPARASISMTSAFIALLSASSSSRVGLGRLVRIAGDTHLQKIYERLFLTFPPAYKDLWTMDRVSREQMSIGNVRRYSCFITLPPRKVVGHEGRWY